ADQTNPAHGGQTATGSNSPITVTGLTNGDSYTFTITATNTAGTAAAFTASNPITPAALPARSTPTPTRGSTAGPKASGIAPTPGASSVPIGSSAATPSTIPLATTGAATDQWTRWGLWLLVAGSVLLIIGKRRRPRHR
ncbi:MAG: hypothetical protein M3N95_17615, partial [Actinomycetota bacterium]|nr:hypothetical protein [Actinomycetota bacterium]